MTEEPCSTCRILGAGLIIVMIASLYMLFVTIPQLQEDQTVYYKPEACPEPEACPKTECHCICPELKRPCEIWESPELDDCEAP